MSQKFKSEVELQALNNATTDTNKFLVSDSGVVKYRTGAQVLSDIGAQSALTNPVTGTGTTNYVSKFTGATSLGNSQIFDNGTNVGIGTTSPGYKLEIDGDNGLFVGNGGAAVLAANPSTGIFSIGDTDVLGDGIYVTNTGTSYFDIYSGGSIKFRMNAAGNVGIGTTVPSHKLDVNSYTSRFGEGTHGYILISDDYYGGELGIITDSDESIAIKYNDGTFRYGGPNPGAETLVISGSNVGIGTTSPSEKLHISSGNLRLESSGIKDTNDSGGSAGQVLKSNNSGEVEWGWVPNTLVSGFLHTLNISGTAYFLPFNTTGETNLSQYYNTFIAPYSGRVRKMIIKFVMGSTPSATSFSTFRVVVNGSQYDFTPTTTGGGTTSMQGVYAFNDDDVVFSEGDKVQFAFITAGGTGLVQGCSATILIEYSQI